MSSHYHLSVSIQNEIHDINKCEKTKLKYISDRYHKKTVLF